MPEGMRVMFAAMRQQAERAGVEMPAVDERGQMKLPAPAVSLFGRPSVMTRRIAEIAAGAGLYLMNDDLVLIDGLTGKVKLMNAHIFREWIDNHCVIYKKKKEDDAEGAKPIPCWLPHDVASSMLASPDFRSKIPRVCRINVVRLPILRPGAKAGDRPRVELLPEGYDAESMTYTVRGLDYPDDMDAVEGLNWIRELLQHFDWAMTEKEVERGTQGVFGRSFSVFMCCAVTAFCESMFTPGVKKPMFLFNGNEVGSGKTLLGQLCLYAVHGFVGFVRWRENEEELIKTLDANARWMRPALFLDDVGGHLKSELLNQWLTEPMHEGRVIGTGDWFSVPRVGLTIMTGNGVSLERDIARRSLMVDLFMTTTAREKVRPPEAVGLSDSWILKGENRRKWLAALWAMVRDFIMSDKPKDWRPLETFEDWSEIVVPIIRALGLPDPLEPYTPPDAGDQTGDEVSKLMKVVIEAVCIQWGRESATVGIADIVPLARKNGLFANVLGTANDAFRQMSAGRGHWKQVVWEEGDGKETREPTEGEKREQAMGWLPPDNKMAISFGMRFGKRATGKVVVVGGKKYQFGKRGSAKTSTYEISVVK
jgi:hypothetical protein